ncbi:MAG: phosphodiester glycosidase family protein [Oscillospiraceae bacterium]|nr:phosphodiester glycosidase family protein [Oscillospiraceae bacterium]
MIIKKKNKDTEAALTPEQTELEQKRRKKRIRRRKVGRVIDRIFGFGLATVIVVGLAALGLWYVLMKGPSPTLRDTWAMTMLETRRFTWTPNIYLTTDEVKEIRSRTRQHIDEEFDASLITIAAAETQDEEDDGSPKPDAYGLIDEDGDGIVLQNIKGNGFVGYLITILDPTRVFVGMPDGYGGVGMTLEDMCAKYGAQGGINAGGFVDEGGGGMGGMPDGLTIIDGIYWNEGYGGDSFAGFDDKGILHVGYYGRKDAAAMNIVNGVSFGPILILNGKIVNPDMLVSGVNPRTAIGQRGDGAVLMLVIDGRQVHSIGATYLDAAQVLLEHGAVNACNMDGGSSSVMYYHGEYVNSCSSANGVARPLPNAFLFK